MLGGSLAFLYDEWDFIRSECHHGFWHNVIRPHNGHPSMVLQRTARLRYDIHPFEESGDGLCGFKSPQ